MSPAITLEGVTKRYGDLTAVDEVDLEVPEGSLCGFLGPNGAGKSTTIRMIMSIIYPDQGRISVMGGSALDRKDDIGYLPEERGLYRKMRVVELLRYVARLKGIDGSVLRARVDDWLERMELPDVQRKRCQELSKGMQQKIQFIASVIHEPDLIILDEPFSGLDPVNSRLLGRIIGELHGAGRTIIFSTHVLHQAEQVCDRIVMIDRGRVVLDDSLSEVRRTFDPRSIRIEAAGNGEELLERLRSLGEVDSARLLEDRETIELEIGPGAPGGGESIPAGVLGELNGDAMVRSIQLRQPTLDDVFVKLVGRSVGEADGAT